MSPNVRRALATAMVVGPLLTVINQTALVARLLHGQGIPAAGAARIALTFVVPFAVSLYSSTMADRKRR